ncbi:SpoIIE family protein phosphatase [Kitasatospora brasiliensis]|uniref:SpoIIE family protein phosphatase n=1 Tax=Kitasatospora brasiliensis TaxID=3058040 RepID=UPI00293170F1|nr:SpoIIE family protein phosphatase [Kitasatospora sp. K002]
MPNSTFAFAVDPDGEQDEIPNPPVPAGQREILVRNLGEGYSSLPLGRYTVHCRSREAEEEANRYSQQMWSAIAGGGGRAPFFRGSVLVTGRRRLDGTYTDLTRADVDRLSKTANSTRWVRPAGPPIGGAQLRGQRDKQCDALAAHRDGNSGVWAFVVCDGVGDTDETAAFARYAASRLAYLASELGSPGDAIRQVRAELPDWYRRTGVADGTTSTAAVATWHPDWDEVRIAWAGDSRVWAFSPSGHSELLTEDHNLAAVKRRLGKPVGRWDHNRLLAEVGYGGIEERTVHRDLVDTLVLCTDGAYHPLEKNGATRAAIDRYSYVTLDRSLVKSAAGDLVADAVERAVADARMSDCGERADNATTLVAALPEI